MKLLVATRNPHKLLEIQAIFAIPGLRLAPVSDFPTALPDVVEDRDTFRGNAEKKATEIALASGLWALADDSGLEVEALGGEPGVLSARYAGEPVSYEANNRKLLARLGGTSNRAARFTCVIALADPRGVCRAVEGRCTGRIIHECRGSGGFGYDPLFVPEAYDQAFAEMDPELKNRISHRARALALAREAWSGLLAGVGRESTTHGPDDLRAN